MYSFRLPTIGGQATAPYTFLSLFNPVGSGVSVYLHQLQLAPYAAGASTTNTTTLLNRITAASGGTLQADSTVNKLRTTDPDPLVEIRTADPAVTLGAGIIHFAPPIQPTIISSYSPSVQEVNFMSDQWGNFILAAGEGVAFHQINVGDADQRWPFTIVWSEGQ